MEPTFLTAALPADTAIPSWLEPGIDPALFAAEAIAFGMTVNEPDTQEAVRLLLDQYAMGGLSQEILRDFFLNLLQESPDLFALQRSTRRFGTLHPAALPVPAETTLQAQASNNGDGKRRIPTANSLPQVPRVDLRKTEFGLLTVEELTALKRLREKQPDIVLPFLQKIIDPKISLAEKSRLVRQFLAQQLHPAPARQPKQSAPAVPKLKIFTPEQEAQIQKLREMDDDHKKWVDATLEIFHAISLSNEERNHVIPIVLQAMNSIWQVDFYDKLVDNQANPIFTDTGNTTKRIAGTFFEATPEEQNGIRRLLAKDPKKFKPIFEMLRDAKIPGLVKTGFARAFIQMDDLQEIGKLTQKGVQLLSLGNATVDAATINPRFVHRDRLYVFTNPRDLYNYLMNIYGEPERVTEGGVTERIWPNGVRMRKQTQVAPFAPETDQEKDTLLLYRMQYGFQEPVFGPHTTFIIPASDLPSAGMSSAGVTQTYIVYLYDAHFQLAQLRVSTRNAEVRLAQSPGQQGPLSQVWYTSNRRDLFIWPPLPAQPPRR